MFFKYVVVNYTLIHKTVYVYVAQQYILIYPVHRLIGMVKHYVSIVAFAISLMQAKWSIHFCSHYPDQHYVLLTSFTKLFLSHEAKL